MPTGLSGTSSFRKFISLADAQSFADGNFAPQISRFIVRSEHVADLEGASLDAVAEEPALPGERL